MLSEAVQEITDEAGIDQLARARAKGLLQIESADPGDAMDLLISCILSAKLKETGERNEDRHTDRMVETFVDKLSKHLSSGGITSSSMSPTQISRKLPSGKGSSPRRRVRQVSVPRR
jgi:hypothetical protein